MAGFWGGETESDACISDYLVMAVRLNVDNCSGVFERFTVALTLMRKLQFHHISPGPVRLF